MKKFIPLLSLLLIANILFAQPPARQHKTITYNGPLCDGQYQLVFEEDFSEGPINTDDWLLPPHINDHSPELMDNPWRIWNDQSSLTAEFANMVSVQNGKLKLQACKQEETYHHYVEYPNGTQANLGYTNDDGNWEELDASWIGAKVTSNHNSPTSSNNGGCFKYGKFCIKAKVAEATNNIWSSFWFFGPTGEVDMFEIYKNEDDLRTNMHMQNLIYKCKDNMNNGKIYSYYDIWDIINGSIDPEENNCNLLPNIKESKKYDLGDLSTQYHEYCMEWTPFKVEYSVDGQVLRTEYQYWYDNGDPWEDLQPYHCLNVGTEYTLYEEMWFPRDQYINLILSLAGNGKPGNRYCGEMLVDEVKVWQKRDPVDLVVSGNQDIECMSYNDEATFELVSDTPFDYYDWKTSYNLEVISVDGNTATVKVISQNAGGTGWVEVAVPNSYSCYDIKRRIEFLVNPGVYNSVYFNYEYEPCSNTAVLRVAGPATENTDYTIQSISAVSNHPASQVSLQVFDQHVNVSLNSQESFDIISYMAVVKSNDDDCPHTVDLSGDLVMYDCGGYFMNCQNDEEIAVYPNPSSGVINLSYNQFNQSLFNDPAFLNQELKIVHAESGQIMETRPIESTLNTPLNIQHYPDGQYYIFSNICEGQPATPFVLAK